MTIDIEALRRDLEDYYGSAMFNGFPMAMVDLSQVEHASPEELVRIALRNNIDLSNYEV